ncbi:MAG: HprK-related kinase B, partial [Mariprofundales bacterium]|nr:HprK-related kinase B [Mariprofundales bacterium]
ITEDGTPSHKDRYFDSDGVRLLYKIRTGMLFLQSTTARIAVGECSANLNQVVNFIINQQMTRLQNHGWLICHAAAVERSGQAVALAGISGGGKSTLMLHLMSDPRWNFLTNDRLFIKRGGSTIMAMGVAKLPRINPGTLLNNPKLRSILPQQRIDELATMPREELWRLEEKYDVDVLTLYGDNRTRHHADLSAFIILNWSHSSEQPTTISRVDLQQQPDLLNTIMKSAGPLYQKSDGSFLHGHAPPSPAAYHSMLAGVAIYSAEGGVEFDLLRSFCDTMELPSSG